MEMMDVSELWRLEYCNDAYLNKNKPTRIPIKEVPFIKNDKRI